MAFPAVAARGSGATTAADTATHVVSNPAGVTAGDLILVAFSVDGNPTCTGSAGWVKLGQVSNSTLVTGAIFWRFADGGANDTLTVTTSVVEQSSHVSLRITNAGTPSANWSSATGTNTDPPSHTPVQADDILWVVTRAGDSTVVATGAPTNYIDLQTKVAAGTGGASTNTAERSLNIAVEDPGVFTSATEDWVSWTVSIPPPTLLSMHRDNFDDNSINTTLWPAVSGGTTETGGRLRLPCLASSGADWIESRRFYKFDDLFLRVYPAPANGAVVSTYTQISVFSWSQGLGTEAHMVYQAVGNELKFMFRAAFVPVAGWISTTYSATDHAWWRIRVSGGNTLWETAPDVDGAPGVWTQRHSQANQAWVNAGDFGLQFETNRADADGTDNFTEFDNNNIVAMGRPVVTMATGVAVHRAANF